MLEKLQLHLINMEGLKQEIEILLSLAKISLIDYIMIKRGSQDMPKDMNMSIFESLNEQVELLKKEIDDLNKLKRQTLVF